jgi:hypothetical protein
MYGEFTSDHIQAECFLFWRFLFGSHNRNRPNWITDGSFSVSMGDAQDHPWIPKCVDDHAPYISICPYIAFVCDICTLSWILCYLYITYRTYYNVYAIQIFVILYCLGNKNKRKKSIHVFTDTFFFQIFSIQGCLNPGILRAICIPVQVLVNYAF